MFPFHVSEPLTAHHHSHLSALPTTANFISGLIGQFETSHITMKQTVEGTIRLGKGSMQVWVVTAIQVKEAIIYYLSLI